MILILISLITISTSYITGHVDGRKKGYKAGLESACLDFMVPDKGLDGYKSELNVEEKCNKYIKESTNEN